MKTLDDIFNEYADILENAAKQYHNDCIAYGKDSVDLDIRHIARDLVDDVASFVVDKFKGGSEQNRIMRQVRVKWVDSYGALTGWQEVNGFVPELLEVTSHGTVVYEDDKVVSITQNYAKETAYTPEQANGIMTIPKACILEIADLPEEQVSNNNEL